MSKTEDTPVTDQPGQTLPFKIAIPTFPTDAFPAFPHPSFSDVTDEHCPCPLMRSDAIGLQIWCDFPDPADRVTKGLRYGLVEQQDGEELAGQQLHTDDWDEVKAFIAQWLTIRCLSTHNIGYAIKAGIDLLDVIESDGGMFSLEVDHINVSDPNNLRITMEDGSVFRVSITREG